MYLSESYRNPPTREIKVLIAGFVCQSQVMTIHKFDKGRISKILTSLKPKGCPSLMYYVVN